MPVFSQNVSVGKPLRLSPWRKIAMGTWRTAGDPSIYAVVEVDVEEALTYMDALREKTGVKLTLTHFVGKAIAMVLAKQPELNCVLRFGRLYPRRDIDVFFQVATDPAGKDLSGAVIRQADQKPLTVIARELQERVERIRQKGDPEFRKMKSSLATLPGLFMRPFFDLAGFFLYGLNLWAPQLGTPRDAFGSAMITSIGPLGLDMAFAPLVPYSRVPLLVAVGAIREAPVVRDGKLAVRKVARLCVTLDHRVIDGMHGAIMARGVQDAFARPHEVMPFEG